MHTYIHTCMHIYIYIYIDKELYNIVLLGYYRDIPNFDVVTVGLGQSKHFDSKTYNIIILACLGYHC